MRQGVFNPTGLGAGFEVRRGDTFQVTRMEGTTPLQSTSRPYCGAGIEVFQGWYSRVPARFSLHACSALGLPGGTYE